MVVPFKSNSMKKISTLVIVLISIGCNAQRSELVADNATLTLVASDYKFTEGPAMANNGDVYFTDQPNNRIIKWNASDNSVSVYMEKAGRANGLYFDHDGSLLACADENFELWKIIIEIAVCMSEHKFRRIYSIHVTTEGISKFRRGFF